MSKILSSLLLILVAVAPLAAQNNRDLIQGVIDEQVHEQETPIHYLQRLSASRLDPGIGKEEALTAFNNSACFQDFEKISFGPEVERVSRVIATVLRLHRRSDIQIVLLRPHKGNLSGITSGLFMNQVLAISTPYLDQLTDAELCAVAGHELGHSYFRGAYIAALEEKDWKAIKMIEFKCHLSATATLLALRIDTKNLFSAVVKAQRLTQAFIEATPHTLQLESFESHPSPEETATLIKAARRRFA